MLVESDGDGSFTYACFRSELAGLGAPPRRRYRCKRCGRLTTSRRKARWHQMWRWLTDVRVENKGQA